MDFVGFLSMIVYEDLYTWCLRYICSTWFLSIRISPCYYFRYVQVLDAYQGVIRLKCQTRKERFQNGTYVKECAKGLLGKQVDNIISKNQVLQILLYTQNFLQNVKYTDSTVNRAAVKIYSMKILQLALFEIGKCVNMQCK